jgi:predicted SAM-dependent methyltransferase
MAGARILHFAPERRYSAFIADAKPLKYIKADLYPAAADVLKVDMLDMQFADQSFDIVIANHVLEHVADSLAALREIRRVLRQGGLAILQTPYSAVLEHTFEDKGIVAASAREYAYGQDDHVRLFGRDIFDVYASAGFAGHVMRHEEVLSAFDAAAHGVNSQEPFFLFERA